MTTTPAIPDANSLFFQRKDPAFAYSSCALIGGGCSLYVYGSKHLDKVEFTHSGGSFHIATTLTSKDARAVAGELIAAADAVDAALAKEAGGEEITLRHSLCMLTPQEGGAA